MSVISTLCGSYVAWPVLLWSKHPEVSGVSLPILESCGLSFLSVLLSRIPFSNPVVFYQDSFMGKDTLSQSME